jgi:hypothetical protein
MPVPAIPEGGGFFDRCVPRELQPRHPSPPLGWGRGGGGGIRHPLAYRNGGRTDFVTELIGIGVTDGPLSGY